MSMRSRDLRRLAAVAAILALLGSGNSVRAQGTAAQTPSAEADFHLTVLGHFDAETLATFARNTQAYADRRAKLEVGLPPLRVTTNADDIERFEHRLAERIRKGRSSRRYQIFTRPMAEQIRQLLKAHADPSTVALILDDGPVEFDVDVNDSYSKHRSLATMPPSILLLLPDLPGEMQYRFAGRHLLLLDLRANMIVDEIPFALPCDGCPLKTREDEH